MKTFSLRLASNEIKTFSQPCVMGVINMSPNSFYKPCLNVDDALSALEKMVCAGAAIIDIGGEATNPNIDLVNAEHSPQQELDYIAPLLAAIKQRFDVLISVDTSQPLVMQEVIKLGADIINDQRSLSVGNAVEIIAHGQVPVCLMHFFRPPRKPGSTAVNLLLESVKRELQQSIQVCLQNGIAQDRIIIDPGFGGGNYGKNAQENFSLLAGLTEFSSWGYPVLVGWSRKSIIREVLGNVSVADSLHGSLAAAVISGLLGAAIIRTHDVKETVDALRIVQKYIGQKEELKL